MKVSASVLCCLLHSSCFSLFLGDTGLFCLVYLSCKVWHVVTCVCDCACDCGVMHNSHEHILLHVSLCVLHCLCIFFSPREADSFVSVEMTVVSCGY